MASAACTAAAGIGVSLTFIFKSCDNGSSTLPESSSVSIEENSSVDSVTDNSVDTANKENVDIYKSHNYPKLAGENDMSISQFAEIADDSLDNMLSLLGYKGNVGQLAILAQKTKAAL